MNTMLKHLIFYLIFLVLFISLTINHNAQEQETSQTLLNTTNDAGVIFFEIFLSFLIFIILESFLSYHSHFVS